MAIRRPITVLVALLSALLFGFVGAPAQAAVGDVVTVSGTVTDSNGNPIPFAYVALTTFPGGGHAFAFTDNAGFYQFDYTMVADGEAGYVSTSTMGAQCDPVGVLSGPASLTVNCVVPTIYHLTVSGTATTDNGKPFGASNFVYAQDSLGLGRVVGMGSIAADGTYLIEVGYQAGVDSIDIIAPDGSLVTSLTGFADGDVYSGVDFTYHPVVDYAPYPVTVHGTVTDKKGRPVAGAQVVYGFGGLNDTGFATTAADGTYAIDAETWWNEETLDGSDAFVVVNGVRVAFLENIAPDTDYAVDYRIGKTRVFEPFLTDVDLYGDGSYLVDVERKIDADGTAEWAVCGGDGVCQGAVFGTKKAEYVGLSPADAFGITFMVFRDTSGPEAQWLRVDPPQVYLSKATFGPKKLDGQAWFDFQGDGPSDLVAWADANGQTSVWTWSAYDGAEEVTTQTVAGKFVSADHLDLDAAGGEELVLVTREGKNYTVSLVPSHLEDAVTVATGRGEPTVTYEDADGDGQFDIVVTYPDRHKHRHHCGR